MGTTLTEIAKTKINPTHRTLFVDKKTLAIDQLKDLLLLFQPEPISSLPEISPHIPLADAPSIVPQNPLLISKSSLKTPVREQRVITAPEQRVFITPGKKVSFPIPEMPTLPIVPNPPRPAAQPRSRDPQYTSNLRS